MLRLLCISCEGLLTFAYEVKQYLDMRTSLVFRVDHTGEYYFRCCGVAELKGASRSLDEAWLAEISGCFD